jgi:hypothetical protein
MDIDLEKRLKNAVEQLKQQSVEEIDLQQMDPVVKMMLVALLNETQKINDHIGSIDRQIVDRYCTDFIPRQQLEPIPAITLLLPSFKPNKNSEIVKIGSGSSFSYKLPLRKQALNYIPLFETMALPHSSLSMMTHSMMKFDTEVLPVLACEPNRIWVGITTETEVKCLNGLTLFIKGTRGISPERISLGIGNRNLDFATMNEMENIDMAEPFDAQQASGQFFSFVESWKESLLNMEDAVFVCITDKAEERDLFKPKAFPHEFQQWLENKDLERFSPNTLWFKLDFPKSCRILDNCQIHLNVIPVVNVDVCTLTLSQSSPIAKLQKQDDSFFLRILETSNASQKQGFGASSDEIIVRDFDAACYNNGDLYRDVRNLYNHFIDDYYAFIEYNDIKDGETLKRLREIINRIGNNSEVKVPNKTFKFDSGTYVMKNIKKGISSTLTKVTYLVTQGAIGNTPQVDETMENKKLPSIEQKVNVLVPASGGSNKATPDERDELLRYFALTNDRLYTKKDIEAFLRKEIMNEFGKEEFKRIMIKMNVEGMGGKTGLERGLYIDIEFKDKKNYLHADEIAFDKLMQQRIRNKSCIAMPIVVKLRNMEE